MRERRRFERIPANLRIFYRVIPKIKTEKSITKDISQGGVRFSVHKFIPKNSILEIRFIHRKTHLFIESSAKVRWIRKDDHNKRYEVGVEFINISKETIGYLINYIASKSKK